MDFLLRLWLLNRISSTMSAGTNSRLIGCKFSEECRLMISTGTITLPIVAGPQAIVARIHLLYGYFVYPDAFNMINAWLAGVK